MSNEKIEDLHKVMEIRDKILSLIIGTDLGETLIESMLEPVEKILMDNGVNIHEQDL